MSKMRGAITQAIANPANARAQMHAGIACHDAGDHEKAVKYFYAALEAGSLPIDGRLEMGVKFGISLRLIGALDDSETVLRHAIEEHPYDKLLPVLLALTLHAQGKDDEAIAELLDLLVSVRDSIADIGQNRDLLEAYSAKLRGEPAPAAPPPKV